MLEFDEIRLSLTGVKKELEELSSALGLDKNKREIEELQLKSSQPNFWDDPANSQTVMQRLRYLQNVEESYKKLVSLLEDTLTAIEIAEEMEDLS
ncbi:MAG: PCRF domain-containing protein, partial [Alphaproteobacteria bacterium]|nr:PCRF domain-containing protein [Alphaproteobacteria bacterium]